MTIVSNSLFMLLHIVLIFVMAQGFKERFGGEKSISCAFYPALWFKLIMGLLLGVIYQYYYGAGDTMMMFEDGTKMAQVADEDCLRYVRMLLFDDEISAELYYNQHPRALFFAKCISPIAWFTKGNYWMTSVYFSLLGFFCAWYLCLTLVRYYQHSMAAVVSFLFYPSVIFWSSGLIKECLAVSMIFIVVATMLHIIHQPGGSGKRSYTSISICAIVLLLSGSILWQLKYYYAAVLFPLIITCLAFYSLRLRFSKKLVVMGATCGISILIISFSHPNLNVSHLLYAVVSTHDIMLLASDPGNVIHYQWLEPTWQSILHNFPQALVAGLWRPLPGDGTTLLHKVVQVENVFLLLSTILALYCQMRCKKSIAAKPLLLAMLVYVIALAVLLALSSPNFGTLMRYKVVYLPFMMYMCALGCQPMFDSIAIRLGFYKQLKPGHG